MSSAPVAAALRCPRSEDEAGVIPIQDTVPSSTRPVVTVGLIVVNALVFGYEVALGPRLPEFIQAWALVPAELTHWTQLGGDALDPRRFMFLVTSMFLHGGWAHVIGNMLYLWIFGDNVEDRLGHGRFLLFYLACGVAASLAHVAAAPDSTLPVVGASGAVAGVLGAYFLSFPHAHVIAVIPILFWPYFVRVPAVVFLGLWFVVQLISGTAQLGTPTALESGGVAFWAHAGGFVAGGVFLWLLRPRRGRRARV